MTYPISNHDRNAGTWVPRLIQGDGVSSFLVKLPGFVPSLPDVSCCSFVKFAAIGFFMKSPKGFFVNTPIAQCLCSFVT
jgi:hypothetical protein